MRYFFTVAGEGRFPFDALSLSQAWPASQDEAEKVEFACPTQAPRIEIVLASDADPKPFIGYWKEKKWPVQKVVS